MVLSTVVLILALASEFAIIIVTIIVVEIASFTQASRLTISTAFQIHQLGSRLIHIGDKSAHSTGYQFN